ncbi:MAG TPA: NAD(P)H-dependent oxidoreductase [Telluria sp.]|jgi:putative NADPH-quinone reductase
MRRILIVQGHPDRHREHLCHALAQAYADGAVGAGHSVEWIEPARLNFPMLSSRDEWEHGTLPPQLGAAQDAIRRAEHLVFFYPLWLGDMPAILKAFLEQIARPGMFVSYDGGRVRYTRLLHGRSARIVISTGDAAPMYRWLSGAHGLKLMRRDILGVAGVSPVRATVVGGASAMSPARVARWRARLHRLGGRCL